MLAESLGRGVFIREARESECWRGERQGGLRLKKLVTGVEIKRENV